jgi:hypothetical protein
MLIAINTPARFVLAWYWVFALSSLVLFSIAVGYYHNPGGIIEFSHYILYLVVGGLTKHLVLDKIPDTFLALRDAGALKEGTIERLVDSPFHRLQNPLEYVSGILLAAIIALWFYGFREWAVIRHMELCAGLAGRLSLLSIN